VESNVTTASIATQVLEKVATHQEKFAELNWLIVAPEVLADTKWWQRVAAQHARLAPIMDFADTLQLALQLDDKQEIHAIAANLQKALFDLEHYQNESCSVIIKGKTLDCIAYLSDAYTHYATKNEWTSSLTAAAKHIVLHIQGAGAHTLLSLECGLHKLNLPSGIRQDLAVTVYATAQHSHTHFSKDDCKIDTFCASGAGGQHINKTESAVRATHIPTGLVAVCQDERSQIANRATALERLHKKFLAHTAKEKSSEESAAKQSAQKIVDAGAVVRTYDFASKKTQNINGKLTCVIQGDLIKLE